ncbi:MAG: hypothetical protein J6D27_03535 [Ruminiclostridium sp.]|nr:hypothetical protein [Ruminiclostridium sp.]
MSEYIEREALIARYDEEHIGEPGRARQLMVEAPACDVAEVKHGKWVAERVSERDYDGSYSNYTQYVCSECKKDNEMKQSNFCPNCGAKMTGSERW